MVFHSPAAAQSSFSSRVPLSREVNRRYSDAAGSARDLFGQSEQILSKSRNVTMASRNAAEKTRVALSNAYKQLERTKQYVDKEALTQKGIRRANASIIQRVGRTESCIDAFQRIFPPGETGGEICWSPEAAQRNLRTELPYTIRQKTRLYEQKLQQEATGSPSRASSHYYNKYATFFEQRVSAASSGKLTNLHSNMATKAVLDHIEVNSSLIGHLVEAKEEVQRDFYQNGDYYDYYAAHEDGDTNYAVVGNPVQKMDQLDHVVNNITDQDVMSFVTDANANTIFQNTVAIESAKGMSPRICAVRRKSVAGYPGLREGATSTANTPFAASRRSSISSTRELGARKLHSTTEYLTKKGRADTFAQSLARALQSPRKEDGSTAVQKQSDNLTSPGVGTSQMLLSVIADASGNPLPGSFRKSDKETNRINPDLLAFNYDAQHVKTAAEKYYIPSSPALEKTQKYDSLPPPVWKEEEEDEICEQRFDSYLASSGPSDSQVPFNASENSDETFQTLPSRPLNSISPISKISNPISSPTDVPKAPEPKVPKSISVPSQPPTTKKLSAKAQYSKVPATRKVEESRPQSEKIVKRRTSVVPAKKPKTAKPTKQRKPKPASTQAQAKEPAVPNSTAAAYTEDSTSSTFSFRGAPGLRKASAKSAEIIEPTTPRKIIKEKKVPATSTTSTTKTGPGRTLRPVSGQLSTPVKKNTPLLEIMAKNSIIKESPRSLDMRIAQMAAKEVLLPTNFSLGSTVGPSTAASQVTAISSPSPFFASRVEGDTCKTPVDTLFSNTLSAKAAGLRESKQDVYPVMIDSLDNKSGHGTKMLLTQKIASEKCREGSSMSHVHSPSVVDKVRALTPDQRKSRLNSILERRNSTTRASIESINRLSLDMQTLISGDAQYSDYTDTHRDTSVTSDQESVSSCSRRSSVSSQSRRVSERLRAVIGPRTERRSIGCLPDKIDDSILGDVFAQRDRILRTLQLDTRAKRTLIKMREFLLLTLIGNALLGTSAELTTPRGSPKGRRYSFKQMYNRHRNLTHALDCDATIPSTKIRN